MPKLKGKSKSRRSDLVRSGQGPPTQVGGASRPQTDKETSKRLQELMPTLCGRHFCWFSSYGWR